MNPFHHSFSSIFCLSLSIMSTLAIAIPDQPDAQGVQFFIDRNHHKGFGAASIPERRDYARKTNPLLPRNPSHPDSPMTPSTPSSLSHPSPHTNSLTPRSLGGWTYRIISTQFLAPANKTMWEAFAQVDTTMHRWIRYVEMIDTYAPSNHFTLGYGSLRMEFWSPAPILFEAVTKIIELYLLLGMMLTTLMSAVIWEYVTLAAVTVLFYVIAERPEGLIPV